MLVRLVELGLAAGEKREIPVTGEEFLIGRGNDCDLRLSDSSVSRHHCLVRVRGDEAAVADLGSSNGTFLNGHRVLSQAPLHNGDEVRVGTFRFLAEVGHEAGISWSSGSKSDPAAATYKISKITDLLGGGPGRLGNEEGHPPGEAGGRGDRAGQESGEG
jgi:pSer/pThr/pTyr-binding forkhead associated (FHA) protein